jgi:hypothetical protein
MAKTLVSDIIIPEIYLQYLQEETDKVSAFLRSGVIARDAQFNALVAGGGDTFNMPFWKPLTGSSEAIQSGTDLTQNKITTAKEVAIRCIRGKNWSSEDIAAELAGDDPMSAIARKTGTDFWAPDMQSTLVNTLKGIFADNVANDSSDLTNNIAIEDGDNATAANLAGSDAIIDTIALLGDMGNKVTAIALHSTVYWNLNKLNLIDFEPTNTQNIGWGTYLGKTVIVDDELPTAAGSTSGTKYTSYMFVQGAVAQGEAPNKTPVETDRDGSAGVDELIERRNFFYLPRGFAWTGSSLAGNTPTNAELATAANWNRVYEQKNVGIVQMITNG